MIKYMRWSLYPSLLYIPFSHVVMGITKILKDIEQIQKNFHWFSRITSKPLLWSFGTGRDTKYLQYIHRVRAEVEFKNEQLGWGFWA